MRAIFRTLGFIGKAVFAIVGLLVVLGFVIALAGGGQSTTTVATSATPSAAPAAKATPSEPLAVGSSATVTGFKEGERLEVTLEDYLPHVASTQFSQPKQGNKFVGVRIRITNVGSGSYADAPSNSAKIITDNGEQSTDAILDSGPCAASFSASVKLAPGDGVRGCIAMEIPEAATGAKFQFTPDSGVGPNTLEWRIP